MRKIHFLNIALFSALLWTTGLQAQGPGPGQDANAGFVGSTTCGGCHASELESWQGSHHDMAMRHASAETVIGDFNDAEITVHGVTSRFYQRDGKYFALTDGPDGTMQEFEISYTFGVEPLQQYLVAFPDGRIQALGIAWDDRDAAAGGQRWYHIFPEEPLLAGDPFHWTGAQQNWNYMCADCHSTNLRKNYDKEADTFNTTWAEINVGCEACHGPGADHVAWASRDASEQSQMPEKGLAARFNDRDGVSWPIDPATGIAQRAGGPISRDEIQMCAACHSRRGLLNEGRETDPTYLNHHRPALLTEGLYHPDGQIQDEVFVWGSYTQSKMYMAGVTCSDCHDPHSQKLKASGSNVCAQCHLPSTFATTKHHGHPKDSAGADCLGCHMPAQTYMGVDDRRDHSMRLPHPETSAEIGAPDACTQCHTDKDQPWAITAFNDMFPEASKPSQHWTTAFHQARQGLPQAEISLLSVLNKPDTPPIARATAIMELQTYLSPLSGQALEQALRDPSALVRMAALQALDQVPTANRYQLAGHLLRDPVLAVRSEAARSLAGTPMNQLGVADRGALQQAMRDYFNIQELNADRAESGFNLGNLSLQAGNSAQAERYYRESLKRDPSFAPAYLNLSEVYRNEGMGSESIQLLRQGLEQAPNDATLHHALGLAMIRGNDGEGALAELETAAELAPEISRYAYVLGVAQNSMGQQDASMATLAAAHELHPNNREILFALATIERDRGNVPQAIVWTEALLALNPGDDQANQLMEQLKP